MRSITMVLRYPQRLIFLLLILISSHGQFLGVAAAADIASGVQFADESSVLGNLPIQRSWGIAWADYDEDGWVDLFVNNHWHAPYLLRNVGGSFVDSTVAAGMNIKADHHACHWTDFNADGALDLYCTTGAKKGTGSEPANFWRNNKNGTFTDIAVQTNTVNGPGRGRSVTWADFDGDGDLDLFVGNKVVTADDPISVFYRNDGATFTNRTAQAGLNLPGAVEISMAIDYEGDGDWDLLLQYRDHAFDARVSPCAACLLIMENNGTGVFTPRTKATTGLDARYMTALAVGDYNNDGHPDIFSGTTLASSKRLLRNNGDGTFSSSSLSSAGFSAMLDAPIKQAIWADFDNDGFADIYFVGNDERASGGHQPNFLYFNNGNGTFRDGTSTANAAGLVGGSGSSAAVADYNNDGFLDLAIGNGGGESFGHYQLLRNKGNSNHWMRVRLMDGQGRLVFGGKIWITSGGRTQFREYVDQNDAGSFHEPVAHFGLGASTVVDRLHIEWPNSQVTQLTNIAVDQLLEVSPGGVSSESPPIVLITSPVQGTSVAEGTSINFKATANDAEDGNLTAGIQWSSSRDGLFGTGGSHSTSTLSVGTHVITASVRDSGNLIGLAKIDVTVQTLGSSTIMLVDSGDAFSNKGQPDTNFGTRKVLRAHGPNEKKIGFIQFDTTAFGGASVAAAELQLRVSDVLSPGLLRVHGVQGAWKELTLTHNNKPAYGASQASINLAANHVGTVISLDITGLVKQWAASPSTAFGIALTSQEALHAIFESRETANRPVIRVTLNDSGNTPPSVVISAPADGSTFAQGQRVTFSGMAADADEGDLTGSLTWNSSRDGMLGSGGSFSSTMLSTGTHTITARVSDAAGAPGSASVVLTITSGSGASFLKLADIGDTFSAKFDPDGNRGKKTFMRAKGPGEKQMAFARFDVSQVVGSVASAILNLHVQEVAGPGTLDVHRVQGSWGELTLTHNNKPPYDARTASISVAPADAGTVISLDITGLVEQWSASPSTAFGIVLTSQDSLNVTFDTREAAHPPIVEVQLQ